MMIFYERQISFLGTKFLISFYYWASEYYNVIKCWYYLSESEFKMLFERKIETKEKYTSYHGWQIYIFVNCNIYGRGVVWILRWNLKYKNDCRVSKIINEYFALKIREYFDESMINNGGRAKCFLWYAFLLNNAFPRLHLSKMFSQRRGPRWKFNQFEIAFDCVLYSSSRPQGFLRGMVFFKQEVYVICRG